MFKMKFLLLVSTVLLCFTSCRSDEQKARMPKSYSIEQLYDNLAVNAADFSADETKILVSSNKISGIYNAYELNTVDTSMKALTGSLKESFFAQIGRAHV